MSGVGSRAGRSAVYGAEQSTGADGPQHRLCRVFLTLLPVGRSSAPAFGFNVDAVLAWCDGCGVIGFVKLYTVVGLKAMKKPAQP
jgi:hypothetical protein